MDHKPASNSLSVLPDGIIQLTQTGHQTLVSISEFQADIDAYTDKQHRDGKKALILVDVSGVTSHDPEVRDESRRRLLGKYDAMAVCGANTSLKMIVNWLIRSMGYQDRAQFFGTRDEALAWLRGHLDS